VIRASYSELVRVDEAAQCILLFHGSVCARRRDGIERAKGPAYGVARL